VARRTVLVSDLSGKPIDDPKDAARITINYGDARRGTVVIDALATEVEAWAAKGTKQARRGRKPKDS
jgi:hypothetical protein